MDDFMSSFIDTVVAERVKTIDGIILGEIKEIAIENGLETRVVLSETEIVNALKKQIPKKPKDEGWLYCPVCGKDVCVEQPNYCSDCGQKLDWSESF